MRPAHLLLSILIFAAPAMPAQINLPADITDAAALPRVMPRFAKAVIAFQQAAQHPDGAALFKAQLVAGLYGDALTTLDQLRAPLAADPAPRVRARYLEYVLYARSRLATDTKTPFPAAYRQAFYALISPLDNKTSALAVNHLSSNNLSQASQAWDQDLSQLKGSHAIPLAEAVKLISDYNERELYRAFGATTAVLIAADDAHRYTLQKDVVVAMPDGGSVCALIIRPPGSAKLPALLQFTIYNDTATLLQDARRSASNDYVGVIGLVRGKGCSPGEIIPYERDGADAAALVDWIAAQPWSDGKVGMFGGSYSGLAPWAAAKHQPKALKSIMVGAPVAPGIDVPMEGNIVWSFVYPWPFYTTTNKTLNDAMYYDRARWAKLDHDWYVSGRPYRELEKIDGTPNPIFDRWISHPSYDAYWQGMIPYKEEFSRISIPVLQTAGYYYGGPGAAVYYLTQHLKYRPDAEHYLIIGPYDHLMAQRGPAAMDLDTIAGYTLDAAAKIDFTELRYRWFDYTLKGGAKPAILADKINYEVTGANLWRHAPSLAAMASTSARYYLSADAADAEAAGTAAAHAHRLSSAATAAAIPLSVDLSDRRDVDAQTPGGGVQDQGLDSANGLVFMSAPLVTPTEMSGLFSGHLEFIANKSDFDFEVRLFELSADGDYFQLAPFWSRASYVEDLTHRTLLVPGRRQSLDFRSVRLMSRHLKAGSRLVAVLSIVKEPGREVNYGTGKDVVDESIADAKVPLQISWFGASYLDLPVHR